MKRAWLAARVAAIVCLASLCNAQTVSTIVGPGVNVDDGLVVDSHGNIFASRYSGSTVSLITPGGEISTLADGFNTPNGLEIDPEGNVYVADALGNAVYVVAPDGDIDTLITSITNPSGLLFNGTYDTLYISQYSVSRISKATLDGEFENWVIGQGLNGPIGMEFDSQGDLIVGNFNNGDIYRINPAGEVAYVSEIPPLLGFLTVVEDHVFATSLNVHQVYRVTPSGEAEVFAGTGVPGTLDGPAETAQFNAPNGIAATPSGDTVYVSDWNSRSLRMITGEIITSVEGSEPPPASSFWLQQNYPNPFNPSTNVEFGLRNVEWVTLKVHDLLGREVATLVNERLPAGRHTVQWDGRDRDGEAVASGVYTYRMQAGDFMQSRQMLLMR